MRHHSIRVLPARADRATVPTPNHPRTPLVVVAHIEVAERTEATGWPMLVTFSDGRTLPSALTDPALLRDYLDYLGLPDNVVTYTGTAREQLYGGTTPTAQAHLSLTT